MTRWTALILGGVGALLLGVWTAPACSLCAGNALTSLSLRQEVTQAKLVLYGTLENPRLNANTTDVRIIRVLKTGPLLGDKAVIEIPRYVPALDAKDPPKYLVFCDVFNGKLDPYRGVPVKSPAVVDYLSGAMALDAKDSSKALLYFFRYLDHADKVVADDAYLEFARAGDKEIGQVAKQLAPEKVRRLLQDPQTPENRIGLYAFLLGACGGDKEAELLRSLTESLEQRYAAARDGLLGGYIQLRPREGWELALSILRDSRKNFTERFAVIRALRLYYGWKPEEVRGEVLSGLGAAIEQGDLADLAVEDLRRWQLWDRTADVLAQFDKKSHAAPIVRRSIVRYALSCPKPEAGRFVSDLRKQDPELVKDVEEALQFEKPKYYPGNKDPPTPTRSVSEGPR